MYLMHGTAKLDRSPEHAARMSMRAHNLLTSPHFLASAQTQSIQEESKDPSLSSAMQEPTSPSESMMFSSRRAGTTMRSHDWCMGNSCSMQVHTSLPCRPLFAISQVLSAFQPPRATDSPTPPQETTIPSHNDWRTLSSESIPTADEKADAALIQSMFWEEMTRLQTGNASCTKPNEHNWAEIAPA